MWKVELSKQASSFAKAEHISHEKVLALIGKFIAYLKGEHENINVRKMEGKWKGYYRIRIGRIRMILKIDVSEHSIFVDRMDYRGDVYK